MPQSKARKREYMRLYMRRRHGFAPRVGKRVGKGDLVPGGNRTLVPPQRRGEFSPPLDREVIVGRGQAIYQVNVDTGVCCLRPPLGPSYIPEWRKRLPGGLSERQFALYLGSLEAHGQAMLVTLSPRDGRPMYQAIPLSVPEPRQARDTSAVYQLQQRVTLLEAEQAIRQAQEALDGN